MLQNEKIDVDLIEPKSFTFLDLPFSLCSYIKLSDLFDIAFALECKLYGN